jgi:sugar transferase EpsL
MTGDGESSNIAPATSSSFYVRCGKRIFDLAATVPFAIFLAPVIVIVAVAVRMRIGRPVLFKQTRPGLNGEPFTILKYRTMSDDRDAMGNLLPDDVRLSKFGKFLRSTSLDELPELWNIICGDMSIVGPRPLLMQYLELYSPEQLRRHEVRPGLTGLAQISGRNAITWDEKFAADIAYIDACTMWQDIKIIMRTVEKIVRRDGISAPGEATMPYFDGSRGGRTSGASKRDNAR